MSLAAAPASTPLATEYVLALGRLNEPGFRRESPAYQGALKPIATVNRAALGRLNGHGDEP